MAIALAVLLSSWVAWRRWSWSDPGADYGWTELGVIAAVLSTLAALALTIVVVVRRPQHRRVVVLAALPLVATVVLAFTAHRIAFSMYGEPLRVEAQRLGDGQSPQAFDLRGRHYEPADPGAADLFFPGCFLYRSRGAPLVYCPGSRTPTLGGTADREVALGNGWWLLY